MTAAFIVVVALALLPQVLFSVLYWKWIPHWWKNPYGRLAQLGSWCHIFILTFYLFLAIYGQQANPHFVLVTFFIAFVLLIFFGFLQLSLLRRAVKSALLEQGVASES